MYLHFVTANNFEHIINVNFVYLKGKIDENSNFKRLPERK
jgi:hypothetical protein